VTCITPREFIKSYVDIMIYTVSFTAVIKIK